MIHFGKIVPPIPSPENIAIIAGGPSLKGFDFSVLKNENIFTIAVNESGKYVPFSDMWFTLDPWGLYGPQIKWASRFSGKLFAAVPENFATKEAKIMAHRLTPKVDITYLHRIFGEGLSESTDTIHTGNSAYGALGAAYLMRPKKVLLLGVDGTHGYYYNYDKPNNSLSHLPKLFAGTLPQLSAADIQVINGSPVSTVDCFYRCSPEMGVEKLLS